MSSLAPVLVVGLDGASPQLIRQWAGSGQLPALRRLIERGAFGPLRSTVPPVSPAAWATFMTGLNPAAHGVLGFRNLDARRYEFHEPDIVSSKCIAGRTFWDFAAARGARVAALWVPVTYPPWPVEGVLVSGYPTPDPSRAFGHPRERIAQLPGLTENSAFFNSALPERIAAELLRLAHERGRVAAEMLRGERFDLFVVVIGSIDRAQHDFWRHFGPQSPAHDPTEADRFRSTILDTYRAADRAVALLLEAAAPDTTVLIVSDHGGGPAATWAVHLNSWLRERGFLHARPPRRTQSIVAAGYTWLKDRLPIKEQIFRRLPRSWRKRLTAFDAEATTCLGSIIWEKTRAYRLPLYPPYDGIVVNLAGRQPHGCVAPADYERTRQALIAALVEMRSPHGGERVIAQAFRREQIYSGDHLERMPDIIVELQPGYSGGPGLWGQWVTPVALEQLRKVSGAHDMDGVLIVAGPQVRRAAALRQASIADVAPTVLYAMGLPCPSCVDGHVLTELFEPNLLAQHPVEQAAAALATVPPLGEGLSAGEQAEIAEHLRGLGYID